MDDYPQTFAGLVAHLTRRPRVRVEHFIAEDSGWETFTHADAAQHLWFKKDTGAVSHTPAGGPCGPMGMAVKLAFRPGGFDVTMFGKTVRYHYAAEAAGSENGCHARAEAASADAAAYRFAAEADLEHG